MRVLLCFVLAPIVGALLFGGVLAFSDYVHSDPYHRISIFTFTAPLMIGGYPPTVILGIPCYFLLRKTVKYRFATAVICGGFVASLPWFLVVSLTGIGWASFADWKGALQETAVPAFFCGCPSGAVFWFLAR